MANMSKQTAKARITINKSDIKTDDMKTMDGTKQKPEKKDMFKDTKMYAPETISNKYKSSR